MHPTVPVLNSSASFVSERPAQSPRSKLNAQISGIAGVSHKSPLQSLRISSVRSLAKKVDVTAVVVPQVTCDLPFHPIPFKTNWEHLSDLQLADPGFGRPGSPLGLRRCTTSWPADGTYRISGHVRDALWMGAL